MPVRRGRKGLIVTRGKASRREIDMSIQFTKRKAPWSFMEVEFITRMQWSDEFHPFTCPNRGTNHGEFGLPDLGALIATPGGWICQYCDYTQDWAYRYMLP